MVPAEGRTNAQESSLFTFRVHTMPSYTNLIRKTGVTGSSEESFAQLTSESSMMPLIMLWEVLRN